MANLGNTAPATDAAAARKKTNKKMVLWVGFGIMGFMVIYLIMRSPDLGRGAMEQKIHARNEAALKDQYRAKVRNPKEASKHEYQNALDAIRAKRQAASDATISTNIQSGNLAGQVAPPGVQLPAPEPATNNQIEQADRYNHYSYRSARQRVESAGSGNGGNNGPAVRGVSGPSFVMYSVTAKGGSLNPIHALAINHGKNKTPAFVSTGNSNTAKADSQAQQQYAQEQAAQNNDPALVQARAQAAQASAQQAAMQAALKNQASPNAGGIDQNAQWLYRAQNEKVKADKPIMAEHGTGRYWIAPGTVINAVMVTAIDTRLPGQMVARVTGNVYDSRYGQFLVIPAGSVLQGTYNSSVKDGQHRVMATFTNLVTPSGGVVPLHNMTASDPIGNSGIPGELHTHFWTRMGVAVLYGAEASELDRLSQSTVISPNGTTTQNSMSAGAQIVSDAANQQLKEMFALGPNITVKPGVPVALVTEQGIEIPPIANTR